MQYYKLEGNGRVYNITRVCFGVDAEFSITTPTPHLSVLSFLLLFLAPGCSKNCLSNDGHGKDDYDGQMIIGKLCGPKGATGDWDFRIADLVKNPDGIDI